MTVVLPIAQSSRPAASSTVTPANAMDSESLVTCTNPLRHHYSDDDGCPTVICQQGS